MGLGYVTHLAQSLLLVMKQLQDGGACITSLYNGFRQLRQAMGEAFVIGIKRNASSSLLIGYASWYRGHRLS